MDSKPVVKLEQTELPILPFSNATNREKIGASDSAAEVSVRHCSVVTEY